MKNIGLVTDVPFWKIGLGQNARIQELYHFLSKNSRLTLYYLGEEIPPFPCSIFQKEHQEPQLFSSLEKANHDLLIVEYIHLHWIADFPLKNTDVYLDALDLLSERTKSFEFFNHSSNLITFEQEIDYFKKFDKVIFLQKEELKKVLPFVGSEGLLLCPHPIVPDEDIPLREKVEVIGFLGSPAWHNIDGIQWFHDTVLPLLGELAEKCIAHGTINFSPLSIFSPRLTKGGLFSSISDYYKNIDIAINPVLYGSGLKIKTVEAIAYGIPLVTTRIGAQGLLDQSNHSFILADTSEEFAAAICALAASSSLRRQLSSHARVFAKKYLTPEACFNVLLE